MGTVLGCDPHPLSSSRYSRWRDNSASYLATGSPQALFSKERPTHRATPRQVKTTRHTWQPLCDGQDPSTPPKWAAHSLVSFSVYYLKSRCLYRFIFPNFVFIQETHARCPDTPQPDPPRVGNAFLGEPGEGRGGRAGSCLGPPPSDPRRHRCYLKIVKKKKKNKKQNKHNRTHLNRYPRQFFKNKPTPFFSFFFFSFFLENKTNKNKSLTPTL